VMSSNVLVVIRFSARRLRTNMTRVRFNASVSPHVFRQIIATVKGFVANRTTVGFSRLVFFDMTDAIVLTYELSTAVVASVRPDVAVRSNVSLITGQHEESALTVFALVRFTITRGVSPFMHLQIPIGTELFRTHVTRVRFVGRVDLHMLSERRPDTSDFTDRTQDVGGSGRLGQVRVVMCVSYVSREARGVNVAFAAVHALFRFQIMNFFMPLKFLDGVKNFPTVTEIVFNFFSHFEMVEIFVLDQIGLTSERLVAQTALVRSMSRMSIIMFVKFDSRQKGFITHRALVGFLF